MKTVRYFHSSTAALILLTTLVGFMPFFSSGRAFGGREIEPGIFVLVVVHGEASSPLTESSAWAYLWARILYVPAYASGIYLVRSLIWNVGFVATAIMLIAALL